MSNKEATTIVEHLLDGTLQAHLLHIDDQECKRSHRDFVLAHSFCAVPDLLTCVSEFTFHGTSTTVGTGYGVVIVRTEQLVLVGLYGNQVGLPEVLQAMCEFGDDLAAAGF